MKIKKYAELMTLKGRLRAEKMTYRVLAEKINMSVDALNNKLNGYSTFNIDEANKIIKTLNIDERDVTRYFFPAMLRNETSKTEVS